MRRILLLGLLASLLMAPAAFAASINQVVRDCADDGVLEGHYSVAQLREALRRLPTDVAEYTSCTDVLSRAIDAAAVRAGTVHNSSARAGGPAAPGNVQAAAAAAAPAAPANVSATTPQDAAALRAAAQARPPRLAGGSPGVVRLTAAVGRNSLPSSVLVVLILLGAAAVAVALPGARRVIRRHRR